MFKRMIVAVITFAALLCSLLTVEAANTESYGNGNGREDFHRPVWKVPDAPTPVKPQPKPEPVKPTTAPTPVQPPKPEVKPEPVDNQRVGDNWLIYYYACGTNIESEDQSITDDLHEMQAVKLPPNVKILIQAGTTSKWHHEIVNANGRYIYDSNGLRPDGAPFESNMYEPETLTSFLQYGQEYEKTFKPAHRIFIFTDHGGVSGVCQDQENTGKVLSLNGVTKGFKDAQFPESQPFDIIAFDACLMASYECANSIDGFARYMVASEPGTSGYGLYYTGWLGELAKNPKISGAELGKIMCNDYYAITINKDYNYGISAAYSVIDMSRFGNLRTAYENFFASALSKAEQPTDFVARFDTVARSGNTKNYESQFVDLTSLAKNTKSLLPEANALIAAIDGTNGKSGAVIHVTTPPGRSDNGGGLSTFYPYSAGNFTYFDEHQSAPESQKEFYRYVIPVTQNVQPDVQNTSGERGKSTSRFNVAALQGLSLTVGNDKHVTAKLTPDQLESVSQVRGLILLGSGFSSSELGIEDEAAIILGSNIAVKADWQSGTFRDDFRPQWLALDGHIISVEMTFQGKGYKLFEAPVRLNGQPCVLQISYTEADKKYHVDGARKPDENGMSSRGGLSINAGDEITPLFMAFVPPDSLDADEGAILNRFYDAEGKLVAVLKVSEGEAFKIQNMTLEERPLDDYTDFAFCFEFFAPDGTAALSQFVVFTVEDGKVTDAELIPVEKVNVTVK